MPGFELLVEDLAHLSNEDLKARALAAFPKLSLWLLRDGLQEKRLLDNLSFWARSFVEAWRASGSAESLAALIRYIMLVSEQISWQEFEAKIHEAAPEAKEVTMTIAEELIAKGRAEGLAKGLAEGCSEGFAEGRVDLLSKLLTLKFGEVPAAYQARLTNASITELDAWAGRVFDATTLDDVFVGSVR